MEDTSHSISHFMAVGAEQRLDDYHFLRNTYETISGQETQLNRILRMLGEDEVFLEWHIDRTPIRKFRSRSLYDFERAHEPIVLPGNIAYQRLREMEQGHLKKGPLMQQSSTQYAIDNLKSRRRSTEQRHRRDSGEYDAEVAKRSMRQSSELGTEKIELNLDRDHSDEIEDAQVLHFIVRYERLLPPNENPDNQSHAGRLQFEWILPSSLSGISDYTIEHQLNDAEWLPSTNKINNTESQIELDVASLTANFEDVHALPRFRLTAHLKNGKVLTSKPTDKINIRSADAEKIILPEVDFPEGGSVRLTWRKDRYDQVDLYDVEMKNSEQTKWTKITSVPASEGSVTMNNIVVGEKCRFRLIPSTMQQCAKSGNKMDLFTMNNVNEWLGSLRIVPRSSDTVDIDIAEEGFKEFNQFAVEYSNANQPDQWTHMPTMTQDANHLTICNLAEDTNYKFRLTPILRGQTEGIELNSSQLSFVLDVKMPLSDKRRLIKDEAKTRIPPAQFAIRQVDPTTVVIEAIVPTDESILFEDAFDVYSKKDTDDGKWGKVGTIDKNHLSLGVSDLEENMAYSFKIHNQSLPLSGAESNVVQQFQFETASVRLYDPSLFLEKFEQSLENIVSGVMKAAAGHHTLELPVNVSLNEVIKAIFLDESLVPNEQYGFETLALTNDLQLFRGPKQLMIQELEGSETCESSKADGEIIIHNYCQLKSEQEPIIVREENGNTRIENVNGDVIIRNVVTDVRLADEETHNQLSMNIVGQAFLKGFHGILTASNFKGIIVVKNVNRQ